MPSAAHSAVFAESAAGSSRTTRTRFRREPSRATAFFGSNGQAETGAAPTAKSLSAKGRSPRSPLLARRSPGWGRSFAAGFSCASARSGASTPSATAPPSSARRVHPPPSSATRAGYQRRVGAMEVRKYASGCGAVVSGIDLARFDDAEKHALWKAFLEHGVLFFENQALTPADHVALARRLGTIVVNKFFPENSAHPEIAEVRKEKE